MKEPNIAAFLDETAYSVAVQFHSAKQAAVRAEQPFNARPWQEPTVPQSQTYTYISNLPDLKEGDQVIVPIGSEDAPVFQLATVVKRDDAVGLEAQSHIKYKWIAQVVDMSPYKKLRDRNRAIEDSVVGMYQRNLRKSFAQQLLIGASEEEQTKLQALLGSPK